MIIKQYRITILSFILILYLSFMNEGAIPHSKIFLFKRSDLVIHFLMYSFLSYIFFLERYRKIKTTLFPWLYISLFTILGATIEILQPALANRSCEIFDFMANFSGVLWGYFSFGLTRNYLKR